MDPSSMYIHFYHSHFTFSHCYVIQFALEVANPQPYVFVARAMFTTSTGALQLWQQEVVQWTREESLAEVQTLEFVDLPEKKVVEVALDGQNFLTRLLRQIGEARVCSLFLYRNARLPHLSPTAFSCLRCRVWSSVPHWLVRCVRERLQGR